MNERKATLAQAGLAGAAARAPDGPKVLTRLLLALAAVALLIVVAYTAYNIQRTRTEARSRAERELAGLVLSFAKQTEITVRSLDIVVSVAAANIARMDQSDPRFDEDARALFRQLLGATPFIATISFIDVDGSMRVHSHEHDTRKVSVADRSHFRVHRERADGGLYVSETFTPRVGETQRRLAFSRRVNGPDGRFAGVIAATMFVDDFSSFFRSVIGQSGSAAALFRNDGTLIARYPEVDGMYERSYAESPMMQKFRESPSGHLYLTSVIDGSKRLLSFRAAESTPLLVNISVDEDGLFADWRAVVWRFVAVGGASALTVSLLFWLALQQQRGSVRQSAALAASEERLRLVTDNVPAMIAYFDHNLLCRFANQNYARFHRDAPAAELSGHSLREIIGGSAADLAAGPVARVLQGEMTRYEGERQGAHETRRMFDITLVPDTTGVGKVQGFYAMLNDITERKRAEQELLRHREHLEDLVRERTRDLEAAKTEAERASRAKTEFLSRMSHELRTPMNAILGFAQVMQMSKSIDAEQRRFVTEIRKAGDHLLEMIDELLELSRIEAGKLVMVVQPVMLGTVAADAMQIVGPLLAERGVTLQDSGDPAIHVLADSTRLRQILVNLLSNAIKYNRRGGHVSVGWRPVGGGRIRLAVTDTGPGIAVDKQALIFRPFERLGVESSGIDGTGIGLALSKQLAELMGGRLGFDSVPGQGSTFWLELPRIEASPSRPAGPGPLPAERENGRVDVLYVEDNAANLSVVEAMFECFPRLRLMSATSGERGLEMARSHRPHVVLLDVHLPGMDGYEVLKALKADPGTASIPVIALSADAMTIDIERGTRAGFAAYLTKPVKIAELVAAVEAAAGRSRTTA